MRLSSIVSLVVVSASLALGGCAADAENGDDTTQPNVALSDKDKVAVEADTSRTDDARQIGKVSDLYANPSDAAKARLTETYKGGQVDPRIEVQPSVFSQVPSEKLGQFPSAFRPVNPLESGLEAEQEFLPYSGKKKD